MSASAVQRPALVPGGLDLNTLNINVPTPLAGMSPGREAQHTRRIRELEDENRAMKTELKNVQAENEKHVRFLLLPSGHCLIRCPPAESDDRQVPRALG
jgi:hypothetical protein